MTLRCSTTYGVTTAERRVAADNLPPGLTLRGVMERLGLARRSAYLFAKRRGYALAPTPRTYAHEDWDWSKSNVDLALEYGCSRQNCARIRRLLEKAGKIPRHADLHLNHPQSVQAKKQFATNGRGAE